MKIAVIGAGIAGLAVAVRLRHAGHEVVVYEKNSSPGGKIFEVKEDGFVWDGGPSFFTDAAEFEKLFADVGKDIKDYFAYKELDEACRYFYKKEVLRGYDSPEALGVEFERVFGEPRGHVVRLLRDAAAVYTHTGEAYLDHEFHLWRILTPRLLRAFMGTPKRMILSTMHTNHVRYFTTPEATVFFDRFATYTGSDPSRAPGLLSCTPHLEHNQGALHAVGGMRSIALAAYRLALDLGVDVRLNAPVDRLWVEHKSTRGVVVNGVQCGFDTVVNAGDVASLMKLHNESAYVKHQKKEHSASAVVLYLGVKKTPLELYLHNIFFSADYQAENQALWQTKQPYDDPTIYINNTSFFEPRVAPKAHENWFVMVNAPAGADNTYAEQAREFILKKLSKLIGTDVRKYIVCEASPLTPQRIARDFNAYRGSIYGQAGNSWRGAFFRPPNTDAKYQDLYHCGVTTHPGGGIPLALRSAKIVAHMIGST